MKSIKVLLAAAVVTLSLSVQAQKAVELAEESHYHLLTENDFARVFLVEIPGMSATQLHRHEHDYLSISLADSTVYSTRAGEAPVMVSRNQGAVQLAFGNFAHSTRNDSQRTFRSIEVEIMRPSDTATTLNLTQTAAYTEIPLPVDPTTSYSVSLDRDTFTATEMQLLPGSELPLSASPHEVLLVALSDLQMTDQHPDGPRAIELRAGEVMWLPGEPGRKLRNTARQKALFVVLQFR